MDDCNKKQDGAYKILTLMLIVSVLSAGCVDDAATSLPAEQNELAKEKCSKFCLLQHNTAHVMHRASSAFDLCSCYHDCTEMGCSMWSEYYLNDEGLYMIRDTEGCPCGTDDDEKDDGTIIVIPG